MKPNDDGVKEIKIPNCPWCKTPIKSCLRIIDHIKKALEHVIAIKKRIYYNSPKDLSINIKSRQNEYFEELKKINIRAISQGNKFFLLFLEQYKFK